MTQVTQVTQRRNTNKVRRCISSRGRNWCFTLNNPTKEEIKIICDSGTSYLFQEETGEQGTPHLQGLLCYPNAVSMNSVKRLIPRAHLEICRNKIASIQYCSKAETRTGEIYSNMKSLKFDTKNDTTQTPNKMTPEEFKKFILKQCEETIIDDELLKKLIPIDGAMIGKAEMEKQMRDAYDKGDKETYEFMYETLNYKP